MALIKELIIHTFVEPLSRHTIITKGSDMKKLIAMFAFVFLAATVSTSFAAGASSDKKATKSATHKHKDCKDCCCDMKGMKSEKNSDSKSSDTKKEESKTDTEKK